MSTLNMLRITIWILLPVLALDSCRPEGLDAIWREIPTGINTDMFHLAIDDQGIGFAVGGKTWNSGYILTTTNGGESWQTLAQDEKAILDLHYDGSEPGLCTGVDGHVWERKTSGDWAFRRLPEWRINRAIVPLTKGEVVIGGGSGFQFGHLFIADSMNQVHHIRETDNLINDLAVCDGHRIVAAGYGAVLYSDNLGISWDYLDLTGDNFIALDMVDGFVGYMVGYGGTILKTIDSWHNWFSIRNGDALTVADTPFRALSFRDSETGVLVGDAGTVWVTKDGGNSWFRLLGISASIDLTAVEINNSTIFVAGTGGHIYSTTLP